MNDIDRFNSSIPTRATWERKRQRRYRANRYFSWYGLGAILITGSILVSMLAGIFSQGTRGFKTTYMMATAEMIPMPQGNVTPRECQLVLENAILALYPTLTSPYQLISREAPVQLCKHYAIDPVGPWKLSTVASSTANAELIAQLRQQGILQDRWNWDFLHYGDSREPEIAGLKGGIMGSLLTMLMCVITAIPLGIGAAIYLQEFAPKARWVQLVELNIQNLAAVPSIIFGILGVTFYLNWMHLPRSSALVGGLTLALMMLPMLVMTARQALSTVPASIKQAAMALGASPMQAVFHHILPASLPGVMTGIILSVSRALGETAPLLLVGMVAFIHQVPHYVTDPATVLPVQIYLWSEHPEHAFVEKTCSGIMLLLSVLFIMNLLAIVVRAKYTLPKK
jgi:phosphate transport system permease protein